MKNKKATIHKIADWFFLQDKGITPQFLYALKAMPFKYTLRPKYDLPFAYTFDLTHMLHYIFFMYYFGLTQSEFLIVWFITLLIAMTNVINILNLQNNNVFPSWSIYIFKFDNFIINFYCPTFYLNGDSVLKRYLSLHIPLIHRE